MKDIRKTCNFTCTILFRGRNIGGIITDISFLGGRIHLDQKSTEIETGSIFDLFFPIDGIPVSSTGIVMNREKANFGFQFHILTPDFRRLINGYVEMKHDER